MFIRARMRRWCRPRRRLKIRVSAVRFCPWPFAAIPDLAVDVEKLKARMDEIADCFVGVESVLDEMFQAGY